MLAELLIDSHPGGAGARRADGDQPHAVPSVGQGVWRTVGLVAFGSALCAGLVALELLVPAVHTGAGAAARGLAWPRPMNEPLRLAVAALIGLLITAVHRQSAREPHAEAMHHAQILLCVSGAMMMVLINDSLARAFGIAGAASIIRFRTPVDDPRDAVVLFLLLALGMASGLGAFALAGTGAAMLCLFLLLLNRFAQGRTRSLLVDLVACSRAFPMAHVQQVFTRHGVAVELREVSHGDTASARYLATCAADISLDALNADLMAGDPGDLRAVSWEPAKKRQR